MENVRERLKNVENDVEIKRRIIAYVRDCKAGVPPVKKVCRKFNLTIKRFYAIFPGKTPELCRLAGKPLPVERMKRTEKAIKSKTAKEQIRREDIGSNQIQLSEEQTKRLLGISHLEKGKDPALIIDELLNRDSKLRKTYRLSLPDTKLVVGFLKVAVERGWKIHSEPNVVDCLTRMFNLGILNYTPETVKGLTSMVEWMRNRKWVLADFVDYVTRHHNELLYYGMYRRGEISFEDFKRRIKPYAQG